MGQVACPDWHEDSAQGFSPDLYIQVDFSGEAASYDSLGLSERPVSAGSAALGNGALMSLPRKKIRVPSFGLARQAKDNRRI